MGANGGTARESRGSLLRRLAAACLAASAGVVVLTPLTAPGAPARANRELALTQVSAQPHWAAPTTTSSTTTIAAPAAATAPPEAPAPPVAEPPPAPAAPAPEAPPATVEEQRGREALALLHYDWRAVGYTIDFEPGRPGYLGMTYPNEHRIVVWVRPEHTAERIAFTVAHELGHAVDRTFVTDEERARYREVRGISLTSSWWACNACSDYATPAGDFAETFAAWQLGADDFRSQVAPPPTPDQIPALEAIFAPSV